MALLPGTVNRLSSQATKAARLACRNCNFLSQQVGDRLTIGLTDSQILEYSPS
ncbi:hypothetical protein DSUL_260038 [Desulfovibrionales bacterium]